MDLDPDLDAAWFSGSLFAVVIFYLDFLLFMSPLRCVTPVQISNPGVVTLHVHCALNSMIIIVDYI
jgi:hypothetical protein